MKIVVKKLWGENAVELYKSTQNILDDHNKGMKQIIVVSAIRSSQVNTTDYLIDIGEELSKAKIDENKIEDLLKKLKDFHIATVEQKLSRNSKNITVLVEKMFVDIEQKLEHYFSSEKKLIPHSNNDYSIHDQNWDPFSLLGFWELLSSRILSWVIPALSSNSVDTECIDLSHIVDQKEIEWKNETEIFQILEEKIYTQSLEVLDRGSIPIIWWYMWVFKWGIEESIGRWYTDATAAICIVSFAHKWYEGVLEIQKSVRGVMSADPRKLYNESSAKLITQLDYVIAREITGGSWANAKLLHSQAIRAQVQDAGVTIHLFDPFCEKNQSGTWILPSVDTKDYAQEEHIFIWGRENIVFFSVSSGKMFHSWILANIFSIVQNYFSVDIISASETEVTFTVDGTQNIQKKLDEMEEELRIACEIPKNSQMEFIEYETGKALVFCVGQHMRNNIGLLGKASSILSQNNINIEMMSQGRLQRSMVFGIQGADMKKAINVLHEEFVEKIS